MWREEPSAIDCEEGGTSEGEENIDLSLELRNEVDAEMMG